LLCLTVLRHVGLKIKAVPSHAELRRAQPDLAVLKL
jgi:hypothetical protein